MSTQAVETVKEKPMEFVPFGAQDAIRLTVKIIQNVIAVPTKSGKTCSDRDAMKFMMLCQAQRLNPFAADAYLVGYETRDGLAKYSLITAHQAFLKRAETCADYEGMESGIILLNEDGATTTEREGDFKLPKEIVVGGWARVYRKGRRPTVRKLSIDSMKPHYETDFWSERKAPGQIVKCAEADALRSTFPTLLGGLYIGEELSESAERIVTQKSNGDAPRMSTLVEVLPAAETQTTQTAIAAEMQQSDERLSAKEDLAKLVTTEGFTFNHFQKWAMESGNIEGADSLAGFDEVQEKDAARFLRAKAGLLKGLKAARGEA